MKGSLLLLLPQLGRLATAAPGGAAAPSCRFATQYTREQVLSDPDRFAQDLLYWEGKFHQNDVGLNTANGMSYDGTLIDPTTGEATAKHSFSAASKEALQVMLYAQAIAGNEGAAQFLSPEDPNAAPDIAAGFLEKKLETYLEFNSTNPGFGGFIPWYVANATPIEPTFDWVNRMPALDNGQLVWAIYSAVQAMEASDNAKCKKLAVNWQSWLDYTKSTAAKVFYFGEGRVCAVTKMADQTLPVEHLDQNYTCEGDGGLVDPYEGELFTWWLYFFGGLPAEDKEKIWGVKRPFLRSVEYKSDNYGPITVQQGFWFSAHEQWKVLQLPYYDVPIVSRLFHNAERVRTCHAVETMNPGMYASVNNVTDETGEIIGYISDAGIASVAIQPTLNLDVITPYSVFPTLLFDKSVGLAWWWNMARAKKMQNPYGSTEGTRLDGTAISSFVSWDTKITTVNALLGGTGGLAREKMKADGVYDEFVERLEAEHSAVFSELKGEDQELCLPEAGVPDEGLEDYEYCK